MAHLSYTFYHARIIKPRILLPLGFTKILLKAKTVSKKAKTDNSDPT